MITKQTLQCQSMLNNKNSKGEGQYLTLERKNEDSLLLLHWFKTFSLEYGYAARWYTHHTKAAIIQKKSTFSCFD